MALASKVVVLLQLFLPLGRVLAQGNVGHGELVALPEGP
jgi:hypothetical protein